MSKYLAHRLPVAVFALALLHFGTASAPAGPMQTNFDEFIFQGFLKVDGIPANNVFDIEYKLFTALTGGTQVGTTQSFSNIQIVGGLFDQNLDFGPNSLDGGQRFVEVCIRPHDPLNPVPFTVLSPRQQVAAAPYSRMAKDLILPITFLAQPGTMTTATVVNNNPGGCAVSASAESGTAITASTESGTSFEALAVSGPDGTPFVAMIANFGNLNDAATVQTDGGGNALKANHDGANGSAIDAESTDSGNRAPAIRGSTNGTGPAIEGENMNPSNPAPAVEGRTNGTGSAIKGTATGEGPAGDFGVDNPGNNMPAIKASHNGDGSVFQFDANGTGALGTMSANTDQDAVTITNTGSGRTLVVTGAMAVDNVLSADSDTLTIDVTGAANFTQDATFQQTVMVRNLDVLEDAIFQQDATFAQTTTIQTLGVSDDAEFEQNATFNGNTEFNDNVSMTDDEPVVSRLATAQIQNTNPEGRAALIFNANGGEGVFSSTINGVANVADATGASAIASFFFTSLGRPLISQISGFSNNQPAAQLVSAGIGNVINAQNTSTSATNSSTVFASSNGVNSVATFQNNNPSGGLLAPVVRMLNSSVRDTLFIQNQNTSSGVNAVFVDGNGEVAGDLDVSGTITGGAKPFKIDHPLDPENKYLMHTAIESPDMMTVYNGNAVTDSRGYATVELPSWFEALNRDYRYQLTVIGRFAQAIVAEKIQDNRFVIRTSEPAVEVSWQVTGIRHDAWANANRIPVEVEKSPTERGKYLHPDAHNQPAELAVNYEAKVTAARSEPEPPAIPKMKSLPEQLAEMERSQLQQ